VNAVYAFMLPLKKTKKMNKRHLLSLVLLGLLPFLPSCGADAKDATPTAVAQDGGSHAGHDHATGEEEPLEPLLGSGSRSDLVFDALEVDLGGVYQHHTYPLEFPFVVDGPDPVLLTELDTSCGCTEAFTRPDWDLEVEGEKWPLNKEIPAGARGAIAATFDAGRYKDEKASTITVRGNFLSRRITLGVKANITPVFEMEPRIVQFGDILSGTLREENPTREVRVTAMKDFRITRWKRTPPGVLIKKKDVSEVMEDGRVVHTFIVTAGPDMQEGRMASSFIGETDLGIELEFMVNASVLGAVKYAPATRVAFGIFDQGTAKHRTIKIESTQGAIKLPAPRLEVVGDAADVILAELETVTAEQHYTVRLTIPEEAPFGSYNGVLRIIYPDGSGIAQKEVMLNARIRKPR